MVEFIIAGLMTAVVIGGTFYFLKNTKKRKEQERLISNCNTFNRKK